MPQDRTLWNSAPDWSLSRLFSTDTHFLFPVAKPIPDPGKNLAMFGQFQQQTLMWDFVKFQMLWQSLDK